MSCAYGEISLVIDFDKDQKLFKAQKYKLIINLMIVF